MASPKGDVMEIVKRKIKKNGYREKIYVNGKPITSDVFDRKLDAKKWKVRKKAEADKIKALGSIYIKDIRFKDFCGNFISNKSSLSKRTVDSYKNIIEQYLIPSLGKRNLRDIRLQDAENIKSTLLKLNKLSISRINNVMNLLKIVLSEAVRTDYLYSSPLRNFKLIPKQKKELVYWLPNEVQRFLDANANDYYLPVYILILNLGIRKGECFGLQWDCIKFDTRQIIIKYNKTRYGLQSETKSKKARYLPMNDVVYDELRKLESEKKCLEYVFTTPKGKPIDYQHFTIRQFYKAVERSGVRKITLHNLRTTFASNFVMNNGNIFTLSKMLGHSSVQVTESSYAHLHSTYLQDQCNVVSFGAQKIPHMNLVEFK